jgi:hypothetical protein
VLQDFRRHEQGYTVMALVKCEECGHDVSTQAETCPHCGAPQGNQAAKPAEPKKRSRGMLYLILLTVAVFFIMIYQETSKVSDTESNSLQDGTKKPVVKQSTVPTTGNKAHDMLVKMSDGERTMALGALLKESNESCIAKSSFFQGVDEDNAAYWSVACSGGEDYSIQVAADGDGSTRILECGIMKAIGVECFKKFD